MFQRERADIEHKWHVYKLPFMCEVDDGVAQPLSKYSS